MKFLPPNEQTLEPHYIVKHKLVGTFEANDGLIDITDPCYDRGTWCAKFDLPVKEGTYSCFIDIVNFPSLYLENDTDTKPKTMDDERIVNLRIVHQDYLHHLLDKQWELIDVEIGVDAGLCGFYNHKPDLKDEAWNEFCDTLKNFKNTYLACDLRDYGITVSSGFGDGCYEVYKKLDGNEIVALELRFN